jgi:NAD(P)-dependent dehydrogenase (short-subunit alcohol dehydrogenase family)
MADELIGKVTVVTGGASGLGRASVEHFLAEGARVVIADVDRDRGEELAGGYGADAAFKFTDVSDPEQVEDLVAFAVQRFGGLHVMFNNAGVSGPMHPGGFLHDDLADFDRVIGINLRGVMVGTQCAARHMAEKGGGSIINTTSIAGIQASRAQVTYAASKAAMIHFTKCVAIDLGQYGVRVNCIAPGNIPTPLLGSSQTTDLSDDSRDDLFNLIRQIQADMTPLNRQGTPEDVAQAAVYLASDRSGYVTGTVLRVDGGAAAGNTANPLARFQAASADAKR